MPQHIAAKPQAAGLSVIALPAGETPEWIFSAITAPGGEPLLTRR